MTPGHAVHVDALISFEGHIEHLDDLIPRGFQLLFHPTEIGDGKLGHQGILWDSSTLGVKRLLEASDHGLGRNCLTG